METVALHVELCDADGWELGARSIVEEGESIAQVRRVMPHWK
ncbi:hypothetical protein ACFLXX_04965 [Chloroflexota bacterium]